MNLKVLLLMMKITEDNQQIAKEEISSDYRDEEHGHIDENMTNNDIDHDLIGG